MEWVTYILNTPTRQFLTNHVLPSAVTSRTLFSRFDHPDIIAGQGTVGLEICGQLDNIDAIIVPVGGAGLIAGVAVAAKNMNPSIQIIVSQGDRNL